MRGAGFTARQYYFTHFEPSQSLGGAKTGDPREKPSDHPQAKLGLSHMWPKLGSNPQRWDDERLIALKISALTTRPWGPPSLISVVAWYMNKLWVLIKCPLKTDQTAQLRPLIWVFVTCTSHFRFWCDLVQMQESRESQYICMTSSERLNPRGAFWCNTASTQSD